MNDIESNSEVENVKKFLEEADDRLVYVGI